MGCKFSKETMVNPPPAPPTPPSQTNSPDLTSYETACRIDPELRSFDSAVQQRASRVINSLVVGVDVRSLSIDSLREVTESLLEMDEDVVKVILECKKDIWKNPKLFNLVDEYFKNSLETLTFCTALHNCLKRARESQFIVNVALRHFEEEKRDGITLFPKTLQELKKFKASGDPFGNEFILLFQSIYRKQMVMLSKLQAQKDELDKKLKSMKKWRKLSNVLFVATFTSVLICSVVAAAVAAPPVLTALAAAAAVPLGSMGKWVNSIWKKYENEIKGELDFIASIEIGTYIVIKDLENIRLVIEKLEIKIEALMQNANFALTDGDIVEIAIDEIKAKFGEFMQTIEDLSAFADKCSRNVGRTRTMILHKMIKYPSS